MAPDKFENLYDSHNLSPYFIASLLKQYCFEASAWRQPTQAIYSLIDGFHLAAL